MNLEIETEREKKKKKTLGKMVKKQLAKCKKDRQNPKIPSYQK